jgi:hypothetical protein
MNSEVRSIILTRLAALTMENIELEAENRLLRKKGLDQEQHIAMLRAELGRWQHDAARPEFDTDDAEALPVEKPREVDIDQPLLFGDLPANPYPEPVAINGAH